MVEIYFYFFFRVWPIFRSIFFEYIKNYAESRVLASKPFKRMITFIANEMTAFVLLDGN